MFPTTIARRSPPVGTAVFASLLLALALGVACGPPPEATRAKPVARSVVERGPFLWQVQRGGEPSYLFGTIHAGATLADLPPVVTDTLDACTTLVVETRSDDATADTAEHTLLPADQSLRKVLGDPHWTTLVAELSDFLPEAALDRLRPWSAGILVTVKGVVELDGESLDEQLIQRAQAADKQLVYLETAEQQFAILDQVMGVDTLRETLDDVAGARGELRATIRAYRSGNFPAIVGLTLDPDTMARHPERLEIVLFARNRTWMTRLPELLARGGVFVAVGVGHYAGEQGLLTLLANAGFQIRRVPGPPSR